jgi:hypothetical protein
MTVTISQEPEIFDKVSDSAAAILFKSPVCWDRTYTLNGVFLVACSK